MESRMLTRYADQILFWAVKAKMAISDSISQTQPDHLKSRTIFS